MRRYYLVGLMLIVAGGCGPASKVAPVSGIVTLDGKPLPKASITFVPIGTKENNMAGGKTAGGMTDAEGRFTLGVDKDNHGAVVGNCRVYITTKLKDPNDDRDGGRPLKKITDKVPLKYNRQTDLTFNVPASGTDQANFDLKSR